MTSKQVQEIRKVAVSYAKKEFNRIQAKVNLLYPNDQPGKQKYYRKNVQDLIDKIEKELPGKVWSELNYNMDYLTGDPGKIERLFKSLFKLYSNFPNPGKLASGDLDEFLGKYFLIQLLYEFKIRPKRSFKGPELALKYKFEIIAMQRILPDKGSGKIIDVFREWIGADGYNYKPSYIRKLYYSIASDRDDDPLKENTLRGFINKMENDPELSKNRRVIEIAKDQLNSQLIK